MRKRCYIHPGITSDTQQVVIGETDAYEARCRKCFIPPKSKIWKIIRNIRNHCMLGIAFLLSNNKTLINKNIIFWGWASNIFCYYHS